MQSDHKFCIQVVHQQLSMFETLNLLLSFLTIIYSKKDLKITDDTQYDFFAGLGGPIRVPGFYEKNETKQFYSKLGEWCKWSDNCLTAYATCDHGKCACNLGFTESNGVCQPKIVYCPNPNGGDALTIKSPKFCHIDATITHVGCSSNEFCFTHPITKSSPLNFWPSGHCCPMLTSTTKLTTAVCPVVLENDVYKQGNGNCERCENTMEQCVSFKIWNSETSYTYAGRCCPMPCRDAVHTNRQLINVDGHCFYHRKYVKANCNYSGQDFKIFKVSNSYICEYACLRNIQCTHFAWSTNGCFLKHANTTQAILQSFKPANGMVCGYIEYRTM